MCRPVDTSGVIALGDRSRTTYCHKCGEWTCERCLAAGAHAGCGVITQGMLIRALEAELARRGA